MFEESVVVYDHSRESRRAYSILLVCGSPVVEGYESMVATVVSSARVCDGGSLNGHVAVFMIDLV